MSANLNRRQAISTFASLAALGTVSAPGFARRALAADENPKVDSATELGLNWLARKQSRVGHWPDNNYPTAIAALAGTAFICSGSTTTQGPYAENIRRTVDYLISKCRRNGLIGDPKRDSRYTYGHGFAMLFLSQVMGEEEDMERREELSEVLELASEFSVNAQTKAGGWGYVSAQDNSSFDEGSTTITQVQGLRGCRNAGITVSKKAIDNALEYIYKCKNKDGGISYSSRNRGSSRPAITAAALAALYNAGDYDNEHVPEMWKYCRKQLHTLKDTSGHWHYTYLYYSQVVYRQGADEWEPFRDKISGRIIGQQKPEGNWTGSISDAYVTAINLIILQLDKGYLPIFQR